MLVDHTTSTGDTFQALHFDGEPRLLAALAPSADFGGFKKWGDAGMPVVSESALEEFDETNVNVSVCNQGSIGQCVSAASRTAFMSAWFKANAEIVDFSVSFVYGLGNGGRDAGMMVSRALDILMRDGICKESTIHNGNIWKRDYPRGAYDEAGLFRVEEGYHLSTFEELCSAVQQGWDIVYGILVGNGFIQLDDEGVPGVGGTGGHGLASANAMKRSHRWGWLIKTQNSWGTRYGQGGYCWLSKQHFEYGGYLDAYAIRTVKRSGESHKFTRLKP